MTRPNSPAGSRYSATYAKGDKVWVFLDGDWQKGTVEDEGETKSNTRRYEVARDDAPNFPDTVDVEDLRRRG